MIAQILSTRRTWFAFSGVATIEACELDLKVLVRVDSNKGNATEFVPLRES